MQNLYKQQGMAVVNKKPSTYIHANSTYRWLHWLHWKHSTAINQSKSKCYALVCLFTIAARLVYHWSTHGDKLGRLWLASPFQMREFAYCMTSKIQWFQTFCVTAKRTIQVSEWVNEWIVGCKVCSAFIFSSPCLSHYFEHSSAFWNEQISFWDEPEGKKNRCSNRRRFFSLATDQPSTVHEWAMRITFVQHCVNIAIFFTLI